MTIENNTCIFHFPPYRDENGLTAVDIDIWSTTTVDTFSQGNIKNNIESAMKDVLATELIGDVKVVNPDSFEAGVPEIGKPFHETFSF